MIVSDDEDFYEVIPDSTTDLVEFRWIIEIQELDVDRGGKLLF